MLTGLLSSIQSTVKMTSTFSQAADLPVHGAGGKRPNETPSGSNNLLVRSKQPPHKPARGGAVCYRRMLQTSLTALEFTVNQTQQNSKLFLLKTFVFHQTSSSVFSEQVSPSWSVLAPRCRFSGTVRSAFGFISLQSRSNRPQRPAATTAAL